MPRAHGCAGAEYIMGELYVVIEWICVMTYPCMVSVANI